jgi:DNA-binding NtrC family response regulator
VPGLPVILCSGYRDALPAAQAKSNGVYAYLMKPVEMETLLAAVRRALEATA